MIRAILVIWALFHLYVMGTVLIADPTLSTFLPILSEPKTWAYAITLDLIMGFGLFAIAIYLFEKSLTAAVLWFVALNLFGNPAGSVYLLINMKKIEDRLAKSSG
jgi:hypothetical protein